MSGHTYTHTCTHIHTYTHTYIYTHTTTTITLAAHAHRGLMKLFEELKLICIINIILYLCKTARHEAHSLIWKNN